MMKENRIVVKAPFKERWEAFKKAYYEWARYNQYKEDPLPKYNDFWKAEVKKEEIPKDFVQKITTYYDHLSALAKPKYEKAVQNRKQRIKAKKKRLRGNVKRTFLDLF